MTALEQEIQAGRLGWFIRLRWLAAMGGLALLAAAVLFFPGKAAIGKLGACLLCVTALNALYLHYWKKLGRQALPEERARIIYDRFLHFQMVADLVLLTLMLFFSGGAGNPLILLYLFHLAISSILFPPRTSLYYALAAWLLPWFLYWIDDPLIGPAGPLDRALTPAFSGLSAYSSVVAGLWYFLSRITLDLDAKEKALRETSDKLLGAYEQLKQLDVYKSRFLRQVVFQLKGPAIDMDFDLSEVERAVARKGDKAQAPVQRAKKRVWTLLELVDDLVWLSRIEAEDVPFHKEWIEVYDTLLGRVQMVEGQARQKGIDLQLHGEQGVRLRADKEAFERVADHLLSNAIKYSPNAAGPVLVEFKEGDGWLEVSVEDQGIGIPSKQRKKIFEEFFRASNARALEKLGTGLGLSIVKRILDWHGGKVDLISEGHQGTRVETFWPTRME